MIARFAFLLAGALVLAGCEAGSETVENAQPTPSPILYEIADAKGEPQGLSLIHI